ncbi:isoprenylcysteine carboxylmethyltransferase family protein [bacterium]|nr:isoprenylcysteine carboxylmethyltransferase family protein [candidate division CSSED10-310 bacterium]
MTSEVPDKSTDQNGGAGGIIRFAAGHRVPITRTGVIMLISVLLFTYNPWHITPVMDLILRTTSLMLIGICIAGRIWALVYISGQKSKNLITAGPYSLTRHPLYFFSFLGALGLGITSMNILALGLIVGFFIGYYPMVILYEERKMLAIHGEEYNRYRAQVPRFIPSLRNYHEPSAIEVEPRRVRLMLISTMSFLGIYLLLELIRWLHSSNLLLNLYQV